MLKRLCLLISLIILSASSLTAQGAVDKEKLHALVNGFVSAALKRDGEAVKTHLAKEIKIQYFSKADIRKKIDELIMNEISALEYLHLVTGYNLHKLLNEFDNKKWIIKGTPEVQSEIFQDKTYSKGETTHYYFVKVKLAISEVDAGSQAEIRKLKKIGEIDIYLKDGEYKIFGFII